MLEVTVFSKPYVDQPNTGKEQKPSGDLMLLQKLPALLNRTYDK